MAGCSCSGGCAPAAGKSGAFRRALWIALWVNAAMFAVEMAGGVRADSTSLLADSLDFLGDAANYGVALFVLGLDLRRRAQASVLKALTMGGFGLWIAGSAAWQWWQGTLPHAPVMGWIGGLALLANVGVALLLYAFRDGDSNMRSVWICSRNDAVGNVAVLLAAGGVFALQQGWPDGVVALVMSALSISGAVQILAHARRELRGLSSER